MTCKLIIRKRNLDKAWNIVCVCVCIHTHTHLYCNYYFYLNTKLRSSCLLAFFSDKLVCVYLYFKVSFWDLIEFAVEVLEPQLLFWKTAFIVILRPQAICIAHKWHCRMLWSERIGQVGIILWPARPLQGRKLHDHCTLFSILFWASVIMLVHTLTPVVSG